MQVFYSKKPYWMLFLSSALAFCLFCSMFVIPAFATEIPDYGENWEDLWTLAGGFYEFLGGFLSAGLTDFFWFPWEDGAELYYLDSFMSSSLWSCPEHAASDASAYRTHVFTRNSSRLRNCVCEYCGLLLGDLLDAYAITYNDFVTSLAGSQVVNFHLDPQFIDEWDDYVADGYIESYSAAENALDFVIGNYSYTYKYGVHTRYRYKPFYDGTWNTFYSDSFYVASDGSYNITFPAFAFTGSDSVSVSSYPSCVFTVQKYYDGQWVSVSSVEYFEYEGSTGTVVDSSGILYVHSAPALTKSVALVGGLDYRICFSARDTELTNTNSGYYNGASGYVHFVGGAQISAGASSGTVYDPSDPEQADDEKYSEDTRVALLMELIEQYNQKMAFQNNSDSSNYFFGKVDEDGNLEGYYTPAVFNETSKIFTEPVSGMQYQTIGWTYDYETRTYDMFLEPGTFVLQGSDVIRILCTYGDDHVTISFIHPDGTVAQIDEYAYVMVASNECALNGHTYNTEITKEPTCTSVGQQTSTCSVCGDQKTEQIPMNEHTSTYSVFKEPSCSDSGIALYTCAVCGTQYTEMIDSLGHDWLAVDSVETTYTLPPGTSCPDCAAEEFTYELDKETALYTCTCSCGVSWTVDADVTEGYTKYSCNRCGATKTEYDREDGDGLFNSVGNFIADGITWCTEKLSQLVDSITSIVDTFNGYLDTLEGSGGAFPGLIGALIGLIPEDLMVIVWVSIIGFVALAVWKGWLG